MITLAAVLTLIAWTVGPIGITAGIVIVIVGLCTDADEKPKLRKTRTRLGIKISAISVGIMIAAVLFALLVSAIAG